MNKHVARHALVVVVPLLLCQPGIAGAQGFSLTSVPDPLKGTSHVCDKDATNPDHAQRGHCRIVVHVAALNDVPTATSPVCDIFVDYESEIPLPSSKRIRWVIQPVSAGDASDYRFDTAGIKAQPTAGSYIDNLSDPKTEKDDVGRNGRAYTVALTHKSAGDNTRLVQYAIVVRRYDSGGVVRDCMVRDPIIINGD